MAVELLTWFEQPRPRVPPPGDAPQMSDEPQIDAGRSFPINGLVEAHSLQNASELNGEIGRVCEIRRDRVVVRSDSGRGTKAIKAHNFRIVKFPRAP